MTLLKVSFLSVKIKSIDVYYLRFMPGPLLCGSISNATPVAWEHIAFEVVAGDTCQSEISYVKKIC